MAAQKDQIPEITPQVVHLVDLLKRAKEGRLRVPKFQREYVWRRADIVDLFDSIARQYPIGTLFLWGSQPMPSSRDKIGPLTLPEYSGETWMVLDGQQRLTTLVGTLLADEVQWNTDGDDDPGRWRLFFDAQSNVFTHLKVGEDCPPSCLPVPSLLDTVKLFALFEKMLPTSTEENREVTWSREDVFKWISRAQEIARAIQGYRIPLVEIKTDNLSIAVESFSRLNRKGRTIGQDEMFSALTYGEVGAQNFHLASEIDEVQRRLVRKDFGEVDRNVLLRAVLTAANLDLYRTDWTRLGDQIKQDVRTALPAAVTEASHGLEAAVDFLKGIGVLNARLLPYSMQLVALSAFFGRCEDPTAEQLSFLKRWFWASSFTGWFGSGNAALMRRLVDEMRDQVSQNPAPRGLKNMDMAEPALPLPLRFDMRSARVRASLCVMLARGPRRTDGTVVSLTEAANLLFSRGSESMSTVCYSVSDPDLRRSPANRILDVTSVGSGQAKNWLIVLDATVRDEILLSHAIIPDSLRLLEAGDNEGFLQRRVEFMTRIEREFMVKMGVSLPNSLIPAISAVDADEFQLTSN